MPLHLWANWLLRAVPLVRRPGKGDFALSETRQLEEE